MKKTTVSEKIDFLSRVTRNYSVASDNVNVAIWCPFCKHENKNNQQSTEENLDTTSEIIPNDDNLEDINRDNTNLLGNDIVEKKESLAAENKNNTDLAERISDDVKISQPSDNSKKESSSKVKKSVKSSNTSNTLKKEEKVKKKE